MRALFLGGGGLGGGTLGSHESRGLQLEEAQPSR